MQATAQFDFETAINELTAGFDRQDPSIKRATKRAHAKTIKWLKTQVVRSLSRALKVPQNVLAKNKRISFGHSEKGAVLWIGTNPISAQYLGKLKQNKRGVKAGKHQIDGAFIWGKKGFVMKRKSGGSYPVDKIKYHINKTAQQATKQVNKSVVVAYFSKAFERELNYEINVKG